MYRSMPGSSSTSRILAVCFIDVFLWWRRRLPVYKELKTKTYNPLPVRSRPIFYRPYLAPTDGQLPGLSPSRPDFGCREGGKSRRKLPDGTPRECQVLYRTRSL